MLSRATVNAGNLSSEEVDKEDEREVGNEVEVEKKEVEVEEEEEKEGVKEVEVVFRTCEEEMVRR